MLYIILVIIFVRSAYVLYQNYRFDKFTKNVSEFLIGQNLHLMPNLWNSKSMRMDELPLPKLSIDNINLCDIIVKPIVSEKTNTVEAYIFTWSKKLTNFDILMGYNMTHKKIDSIKLDKGEIRDKNIDRLLQ